MAYQDNDDQEITGINVTPLVDVVLVLLVMFMISAPILYQSSVKVDLPKAKSSEGDKSQTLKFVLSKNGEIFLNKEKISLDQITSHLLKNPSASNDAVVAADQSVSHGQVIELIDKIRLAGIKKVSLAVDSAK